MLEKLAHSLGRKDEEPNIALATQLCEAEDKEGVLEIIGGLKEKATANDCIKVLYEIGYRKPFLISEYDDVFSDLLSSKNNRLVWGAMTALATITPMKLKKVANHMGKVIKAYEKGSVITIDMSISVFVLCFSTEKGF